MILTRYECQVGRRSRQSHLQCLERAFELEHEHGLARAKLELAAYPRGLPYDF